jgi:phage-related protein
MPVRRLSRSGGHLEVFVWSPAPGLAPVYRYYRQRTPALQRSLKARLSYLIETGDDSNDHVFKRIEGDLWEVKLPDNHRFVCVRDGIKLVFVHAFKKPGNAIPQNELRTCRERAARYRLETLDL